MTCPRSESYEAMKLLLQSVGLMPSESESDMSDSL